MSGAADSHTGAERIAAARAEREAFDSGRRLPPGTLSPRARVAALLDPGSFFEIGALARGHQEAEAPTPADGVIAGFGRIGGHEAGVFAEDPLALAHSDGAVGRNKRLKVLSHALQGALPIIYLADGARPDPDRFAGEEGRLLARYSDQLAVAPQLPLEERRAPFITAVFGACSGGDATLAASADVIVGTPGARLTLAGSDAAANDALDAVIGDDEEAIATVRRIIATIPASRNAPLTPEGATDPEAALPDDIDPSETEPGTLLAGLLDAASLVPFAEVRGLHSGMGRVAGYPVLYALGGGPGDRSLGTASLRRIERVAALSRRFALPLLIVQHGAGYDPAEASTPGFLAALRGAIEALRHAGPKLVLVSERGHLLGDFALGGRELGVSYVAAWPQAAVGVDEVPAVTTDALDALPNGVWDAAGIGLLDDVVTASETRERIERVLGLLAPSRALPPGKGDEGGRIIYR